jgi:hypothetical protein
MTRTSEQERSAGRFSCVVDQHPRFHLDALRWFASLTEVAGVDPSHLVVHAVGTTRSEVLDVLQDAGVEVRGVEPFDRRSPHCNKIAGALRMAEDGVRGPVVLCDTDTAFLEDPRRDGSPATTVAGKLVDAPVPSLEILRTIFDASGVTLPPVVPLPWRPGHHTVAGNVNGGLYLIPGALLPSVASGWATWAHWLLDRRPLLRQYAVYVDQVAMALCLADAGIDPVALEPRWNTPIHDPSNLPRDGATPAMIHYHQEVDRRAMIRLPGVPSVDRAVATVNDAVRAVWDRSPMVDTYQRWLASAGLRSDTDRAAEHQRSALATALTYLEPTSAVQIGESGPEPGVDRDGSTVIEASGDWMARIGSDRPVRADLTVCLGPLVRIPDAAGYREALGSLWESSGRALLVSGLDEPPDLDDTEGRFHEPLFVSLRSVAPEGERYRIATAPPLVTYLVLRRPGAAHPRDFSAPTLDGLSDRHPDLLGLAALRLHARTTTTFYPDHAPRLWEYPVVAGLITDRLPTGSRLVDVGAGVTPLAPFLTSLGYVVDTVDPSSVVRSWPPQPDWNEWDYLDYGAAGLAHRSWNNRLDQLPDRLEFEAAYSISVIEHVTGDDRRRLLGEMAARVVTGGLVVLTIDLVRGTDDLWNKNLGVDVEDPSVHGTFDDVITEAAAVGLDLVRREAVREWGDVAVDIGLACFEKRPTPRASTVLRRLRRLRRLQPVRR